MTKCMFCENEATSFGSYCSYAACHDHVKDGEAVESKMWDSIQSNEYEDFYTTHIQDMIQQTIYEGLQGYVGEQSTSNTKEYMSLHISNLLKDLESKGYLNVKKMPIVDIDNEKEIQYLIKTKIDLLNSMDIEGSYQSDQEICDQINAIARKISLLRTNNDPSNVLVSLKDPDTFEPFKVEDLIKGKI